MKQIDFLHELYFICNANWDNVTKDKAIDALRIYKIFYLPCE